MYTVCSFCAVGLAFQYKYCTHVKTDAAHLSGSPRKPSPIRAPYVAVKMMTPNAALKFVELSCKKETSNGHDP